MIEVALLSGLLSWLALGLWFFRHPQAALWHPASLYWLVHGFLFVLRPIWGWFNPFTFVHQLYGFTPSEAERATALWAAQLACAVFMVVAARIGRQAAVLDSAALDRQRTLLWPAALAASLLLAPIALYAKLTTIQQRIAENGTMVLDARTGIAYNTQAIGWLAESQAFLMPIAVMIAFLGRFRPLALLPLAGFILLQASTGGRVTIIVGLLALVLLRTFARGRRWPGMATLGLGVAALALFMALGADRGASVRALYTGNQVQTVAEGGHALDHMDFASAEYVEYQVWLVPERSRTYGYFVDLLQVFTEPVPRVLWPQKPLGPPIQLIDYFKYAEPIGFTRSLPGYGWTQGGWLGVALWAALAGWLFGAVYQAFARRADRALIVLAYMIFIAGTLLFFRDGTLLTVLRFTPFYLGPVVLAAGIEALRRKWRHHGGPLSEPAPHHLGGWGETVPRAWRGRAR